MNKIYVVGMGPGDDRLLTRQAWEILKSCDIIIGYTVYAGLMKQYLPGKEYLTTPMRREAERCHMAFAEAGTGKTVAMICSGDAGVYGMAGLMLEIGAGYPDCRVEMIPGVTAALAGAAVLGAPLMHDFAVISLSDLLTPWETIEKRLRCAAAADLGICIYNPASKKRAGHLARACDVLLKELPGNRICGVVARIGREGQESCVLTLEELRCRRADMFTTVFIGNSQTKEINGAMVTPRGYRL